MLLVQAFERKQGLFWAIQNRIWWFFSEFVRIYLSLPEFGRILSEFIQTGSNSSEFARIHSNLFEFIRICSNKSEIVRINPNLSEFISVCLNSSEFHQIYPNFSKQALIKSTRIWPRPRQQKRVTWNEKLWWFERDEEIFIFVDIAKDKTAVENQESEFELKILNVK